jgi:signal transduction histidine kinase
MSVAARRRAEPGSNPEVTGIRLAQQAAETATEARHVLDGLGPAAIASHGLAEAIELLAGRLAPEGSPAITVRSPTDLPRSPLEATLYAIAVEALNNAVRHARATHVSVALTATGLTVVDDGVGLPGDPDYGLGLASMRRRAEAAGGALTLTSDDAGTRIDAQFPG